MGTNGRERTGNSGGRVLRTLLDAERSPAIGVVGSPSDTREITIDILETAESARIVGQMVYLVLSHEGGSGKIAVLGQISRVETRNRWHEDLSFRGIIKRQGGLPHLSARADVRTATLTVQAAFAIETDESDEERCVEDMLGTSPATGTPVFPVRDEVLNVLLEKHRDEMVFLGNVFGTDVKMPFTLRHFGRGSGGAGEAYHIGVFGKTGSGKSGLAAYLLLAYARHRQMGLLFIDPQGQFSSDKDLPFPMHLAMRRMNRTVRVYRLATQVRLRESAEAFAELLRKVNFYRFLGIRNADNVEVAIEVLQACVRKALTDAHVKLDAAPPDLLRRTLQALLDDARAAERIYTGRERREQLIERVRSVLADSTGEFEELQKLWRTTLDLFQRTDSQGNDRTGLWEIVGSVIGAGENDTQPIVFLDISGEGTAFKDSEEIKALLLKEIANDLNVQGGKAFQSGKRLNCLVALDEAHRYVKTYSRSDDNSEMAELTRKFTDAVRTTRKYGLGFMFITQTLASLNREIIGQLRLCAFGYGLTMGSEMAQLQEMIGDEEALSLYRSFVDPQSSKQYPFMFTGPVSPLSFTGSPLFVRMFNRFSDFREANRRWAGGLSEDAAVEFSDPLSDLPPGMPVSPGMPPGAPSSNPSASFTANRGFVDKETFHQAKKRDFD
ncbi:MAG: DUF87 domain-containing protein [Capsulimonadales bacterium]|nr:DUF87 domain-containing protein [Capsulimonadales bacterium]